MDGASAFLNVSVLIPAKLINVVYSMIVHIQRNHNANRHTKSN